MFRRWCGIGLDAKPVLDQQGSLAPALRPIAAVNSLFGDYKVKDIAAFRVTAEAVEFSGLGIDRKRRRFVFVEWTAQAQL